MNRTGIDDQGSRSMVQLNSDEGVKGQLHVLTLEILKTESNSGGDLN